jgi:DNA repair protein RadC
MAACPTTSPTSSDPLPVGEGNRPIDYCSLFVLYCGMLRATERPQFPLAPTGGNKDAPAAAPAEAPHFAGHRMRLRERFLEAGAAALADYELIELVLFRAIARRDCKPLAKALLARFGSFAEVVSASRERLKEVAGLSDAAITELKIVQAAAGRLARGELKARHVLSSWSSVLDYCRTVMAYGEREEFRVLFLDKRNHLIADERQ